MPQVKGDDGTSSGQGFIRYGVWGDASDGPAVVGTVQSGWGVLGSAIRRRYGQAPGAYYPAYAGVTGYSDRGTGVFGKSDYDVGVSGEGYEVGVRAETFGRGDAGIGVSARAGSIGVQAARQYENDSPDFIGVVAEGGPDGIAGYFENATIRRGSKGHGSGPLQAQNVQIDFGLAGYFYGDVEVVGMLSKSGGGFRIDHPLDPGRQYLSHSFVESSDMKNIYDGTVRLDRNGEAVVKLPPWCAALNRDFRYQLTPIGAPAPNLHVAGEIHRDRFRIAGGRPRGKVSWQVTGIRQDAWANAHRIGVEERKGRKERGHYLHPELVRKPIRRNVMWARHPEKMEAVAKDKRTQAEIRRREERTLAKRGKRARRSR